MSKDKLIPELRFPEFQNEGEWEIKEVGEIFDVTRGYVLAMSLVQEQQSDENPYPVFSSQTKNNGLAGFYKEYLYKDAITWTTDGANAGDVNYRSGKFYCTNVCGVLLNKDGFANKCISELINSVSKKYVSYVGNPKLMNGVMSQIKIPVPKIKEQQKIATCLSSLNEVITAHSQKLELLKDHKKGLMQNLFPQEGEKLPKYRFKEFEKDGEWSLKQLGVDNLIEIKGRIGYRGYTTEDIVSKGEGAISMSPSNIDENWNLNFEKSTYITWEKYEESPEIMLADGFTALVKTGSSYGKAAYIKNLIEKTTINPQLVVLKPKKIRSYFLYLLVTNFAIQKQIQETVVGGAIPTLSQDSISKFEVLIPKPKEQQKIAECFSALNDLIILQTQRIEQLKLHKKGLMQSLFPKIID